MERYRDIRLEMPGAEAMPFWALGSEGDGSTEDLAAWLRDTGGDAPVGGFGSDIDASWLGGLPATDELGGFAESPVAGAGEVPAAPAEGTAEAGA